MSFELTMIPFGLDMKGARISDSLVRRLSVVFQQTAARDASGLSQAASRERSTTASTTRATPSSALEAVTSLAAASASGWAPSTA